MQLYMWIEFCNSIDTHAVTYGRVPSISKSSNLLLLISHLRAHQSCPKNTIILFLHSEGGKIISSPKIKYIRHVSIIICIRCVCYHFSTFIISSFLMIWFVGYSDLSAYWEYFWNFVPRFLLFLYCSSFFSSFLWFAFITNECFYIYALASNFWKEASTSGNLEISKTSPPAPNSALQPANWVEHLSERNLASHKTLKIDRGAGVGAENRKWAQARKNNGPVYNLKFEPASDFVIVMRSRKRCLD